MIEGDIVGLKNALRDKYERTSQGIQQFYDKKHKELMDYYNTNLKQIEEEKSQSLEEEAEDYLQKQEIKRKAMAYNEYDQKMQEFTRELIGKLKLNETSEEYISFIKRKLINLGEVKITAGKKNLKTKITKIKGTKITSFTIKKQQGVKVTKDNIVYDYTIPNLIRENRGKIIKNYLSKI